MARQRAFLWKRSTDFASGALAGRISLAAPGRRPSAKADCSGAQAGAPGACNGSIDVRLGTFAGTPPAPGEQLGNSSGDEAGVLSRGRNLHCRQQQLAGSGKRRVNLTTDNAD
jgi:hypothetical protein